MTDWATDFDPFDSEFVADPFPMYEELRDRCPVAHSDRYGGMTVLTRFDDVSTAAHDTDTFSSQRIVINEIPIEKPGLVLPPINLDPPDHTPRRRLLLPFFGPKAVRDWEAPIREICGGLLDRLEGRTEADGAREYAQEVPGEITARMLGVPSEDTPQFRQWLHELLEVGPTDTGVAKAATEAMLDYLQRLVAERRAGPAGGDMVSYLLDQRIDDEVLTDDEIVRTLFLVLIAGIDTTWSAIGLSLEHLATHPEDRRRLVVDPSLLPTAVEEFLRMYSPVFVARVTTEDTEVGGCPVPHGDWTVLAYPSANRDPDAFEQADEFVIDRQINRHSAFGLGVHRCLGSNLARLEMQIALEMWLERIPEFTLSDPGAITYSAGHIRGPRRLPIHIG